MPAVALAAPAMALSLYLLRLDVAGRMAALILTILAPPVLTFSALLGTSTVAHLRGLAGSRRRLAVWPAGGQDGETGPIVEEERPHASRNGAPSPTDRRPA